MPVADVRVGVGLDDRGLVAEQWGLPAVFVGATALCLVAIAYPVAVVRQRMVTELELPVVERVPSAV